MIIGFGSSAYGLVVAGTMLLFAAIVTFLAAVLPAFRNVRREFRMTTCFLHCCISGLPQCSVYRERIIVGLPSKFSTSFRTLPNTAMEPPIGASGFVLLNG